MRSLKLHAPWKRAFCISNLFVLVGCLAVSCGQQSKQEHDSGSGPPANSLDQNRQTAVETFARELAARGYLDMATADELRPTIVGLAAKTKFRGAVHINDGFSSNTLNIFIIKPHACQATDGVCAYAGENTIFCDSGFLSKFLEDEGVMSNLNAEAQMSLNRAFRVWVLGHEIAHADLGHVSSTFCFVSHPATQKEAEIDQTREIQADSRFAQFVSPVMAKGLDELLITLFNRAYLMKYHAINSTNRWLQYDSDSSLQYTYSLDFSHPDWTVRCAHLISFETQTKALRSEAQEFLNRTAAPALLERLLDQETRSNLNSNVQPKAR